MSTIGREHNLPTGPRLGRIAGQLDDIALRLETMLEAQTVADGEMSSDLTVRLIQLQHTLREALARATWAVAAVNRAAVPAAPEGRVGA